MYQSLSMQERLRTTMRLRDVSVTELSLDLDVSKASVSEWLSSGKISFDHLVALSIRLNLSIHWLLTGMGDMSLHGSLRPSRTEFDVLQKLRALGGDKAVEKAHQLLATLMHAQLGDEPMQQVMYQKILHDLACPLCVLDERGVICDANTAFLQLVGIKPENTRQLVGHHLVTWLPRGAMDTALTFLQKIQENQQAEWFQGALKNNESKEGWVSVNVLVKMRKFSGLPYFDCLFFAD